MKMRASLSGISIYVTLTLIIPVFLLFIQAHGLRTQTLKTTAGRSVRAAGDATKSSSRKPDARWTEAYGKLPMGFEQNLGQTDPQVRFLSRGSGYELFLTPQEAVLSLRYSKPMGRSPLERLAYRRAPRKTEGTEKVSVLRMHLEGANPTPEVVGLNRLPGRTDYYIGNDPKKWRTDVPSYAQVQYQGIYPGVDLIFYGNQHHLEYDFVVAPGADPKAIALDVQGARKLRIDPRGNLMMSVSEGEVELEKPIVYQEIKGNRHEIPGKYTLASNHRVTFAVSEYDPELPLVIDPALSFSTYLGGNGLDSGDGIAVDSSDNVYVAGVTSSTNFPTVNHPLPGPQSYPTVFVTEMKSDGTALLYSTYLSGSTYTGSCVGEMSGARGIALDPSGNIYVTGQTCASDFPTTMNAYNTTGSSDVPANGNGVVFVSVINPASSGGTPSLVYSTYLVQSTATSAGDLSLAIAAEPAPADMLGSAYVVGVACENLVNAAVPVPCTADFPQVNPIPPPSGTTLPSVVGSAFVARIDTKVLGASGLVYSTYLGGNGVGPPFGDEASGVVADSSKNAYIVGGTTSTNFPTAGNAFLSQPFANGVNGAVFVSRIDTTITTGTPSLIYSTYLAGPTVFANGDFGLGIALGPSSVVYVTGSTTSSDFPVTAGSYQSASNSGGVVFVSLIDTNIKTPASSLKYSALVGGNGGATGYGIQADASGNAYVAGGTGAGSVPFPVTLGALQPAPPATAIGDPFFFELNPEGNGTADLLYSTLLGGSGSVSSEDTAFAIAIDSATPANAYLTGQTFSTTNYPVYPATAYNNAGAGFGGGLSDAFVAKLTPEPTLGITPASPPGVVFPATLIGSTSTPQTVTLTNNTGAVLSYTLGKTGSDSADFTVSQGTCPAGSLTASATPCTLSVTFTPSAPPTAETANLAISYTAYGIAQFANSQTVLLSGAGTTSALSLTTSLTFSGQYVTTTSSSQPAIFTNSSGTAVSFTTPSISGDYAFTVDATSPASCSAATPSVPASSSCQFDITFKPVIGAACSDTGTFTVTPSGGGALTTALSGTPWAVSVSAQPTSLTVNRGTSGNVVVTGTWSCGYTGTATIASSGGPTKTTILIVNSTSAALGNSINPANPAANVTVITTAFVLPPESIPSPPVSPRKIILLLTALASSLMLPAARRFRTRLSLAGIVLGVALFAGCSGGPAGTPTGTTTLTLTAASSGVSQTIAVQVTVNP
jgi:hypothetical protein